MTKIKKVAIIGTGVIGAGWIIRCLAHNKIEKRFISRSSLRPVDSPFGHCAANPGNDKNFEKQLDKNIKELLN